MLQVLQYRYPMGPPSGICPPMGIESVGGGGRTGEFIGGIIPGSVVAHFHNDTIVHSDDSILIPII